MRTIFQWLRWVCLLLLGLAWTTTPSFAAVGALNQANGGLTIRYDATETQNRGYDAEPLRAWDNNPPEMVDASAFFGSPAQFLAAKTAAGEGTQLFRVFGNEAKGLGQYYTTVNPGSVANFREAAGLFPGNSGQFVLQGTLKNTEGVIFRGAAPGPGGIGGGLPEVFVPNPQTQINILRVSGANPGF